MKKTKIFLLILLGFALGALSAVGIYFLTIGEVAWEEYVETKLIPNAVLALSAIGALCIAAYPTICKVLTAVNLFNKATKDVNETVSVGKKTEERLKEQDEKIAEFKESLDKVLEGIEAVLKKGDEIEEIEKLGFCNNEDLVVKGFAAQIAKVGKENEE